MISLLFLEADYLQYISAIGSSADASAYANAVSLAIGNTLANAGNISPTLTASLASTDIQPIANLVNSVTSTTLNIQQPNLIRSGGASAFSNVPLTQNQGNRGNLASVQSLVGKRFQPSLMRFRGQGATTAAAGVGQEAGISTATTDINVISKFANTISSSLLSSNEFTSIFGSGLPVTTALNLASNLAQSLATQIGLDEVGIKSLLSLLSQYISAIGSSADASAYANAVSLAIGNTLANVRNISPILTASLVSTDIQPIANLVNSVTSSTLSTQQPNLIRRGGASGLRSAVNSRLSRPGLITASPPVSGAAGAAISESGLIEQVNANPSAVSTAGIGNLAISSAATSSTTGLGGGSVSPASDVGSSAVSAPSSIDPSSRISSAASFMVSGRSFNPNALPSVISYLANQVRASAANLSDCEIVSQVLLETLSAVTHLLRYAVIDEVNYSDLANTASFIGQALG
ncbi:chitinase-like protein PB1E7.04c [Stegodyphus dumicola]|uniref:chitinase-like protein PB1E7.04c n=1 Tax=Stegodyphus dumicola TaxID=202533 RepID=UPI0015B08BBE|nr:chitinase-like protein PB1E7.04c [Stegodyphus dumicola]